MNFTQLPAPGCRAAAQGAGAPSPGSEPRAQTHAEPPHHHRSRHASRHTSVLRGTGRRERSGGMCPFLHLTWLLPILLQSIPPQLKVHFCQPVTDTRRCGLSAGCAPDRAAPGHHAQPTSASPPADPSTLSHPCTGDSTHIRRATMAPLAHLENRSCHPGEGSCRAGVLCKIPARSRKPFLDAQGGSGNAHELGQLDLSWGSPLKVLAPPEVPSLCPAQGPKSPLPCKTPPCCFCSSKTSLWEVS